MNTISELRAECFASEVAGKCMEHQRDLVMQELVALKVRLESLSIKWNKRGRSSARWDEALEELEETYK